MADAGLGGGGQRVGVVLGQVRQHLGVGPDAVTGAEDTTGLDVDAIQGAGLIDGTCVFGEVRDGSVTVTVLPVLGSGLCFVGDQR